MDRGRGWFRGEIHPAEIIKCSDDSPRRRSISKDDCQVSPRLEALSQPKKEVDPPIQKFEAPVKKVLQTRIGRPSILIRVEPTNLESAMEEFFTNLKNGIEQSPIFEYAAAPEAVQKAFSKKSTVDFSLLEEAKIVIDHVMNNCGGAEAYLNKIYHGDRVATKELVKRVQQYLEDLNVEDKVEIRTNPNMLSAANIVNKSSEGKYIVNLTENSVSERMVESICDHEIGTHLLRMLNNEHQVWHRCRERYNLIDPWVTEEGFATINTYRSMPGKIMFPQALKYYATCIGSKVSFMELYKKMEIYNPDPKRRFRMCCRIKRGLRDTSEPGAFNIDQAYFRGAFEILRKIDSLQFARLYSGQVALEDLDKVFFLLRKEVLRLPKFMNSAQTLKTYMKHCRQMLEENFITIDPTDKMKSTFMRTAKELFTKASKEKLAAKTQRELELKRISYLDLVSPRGDGKNNTSPKSGSEESDCKNKSNVRSNSCPIKNDKKDAGPEENVTIPIVLKSQNNVPLRSGRSKEDTGRSPSKDNKKFNQTTPTFPKIKESKEENIKNSDETQSGQSKEDVIRSSSKESKKDETPRVKDNTIKAQNNIPLRKQCGRSQEDNGNDIDGITGKNIYIPKINENNKNHNIGRSKEDTGRSPSKDKDNSRSSTKDSSTVSIKSHNNIPLRSGRSKEDNGRLPSKDNRTKNKDYSIDNKILKDSTNGSEKKIKIKKGDGSPRKSLKNENKDETNNKTSPKEDNKKDELIKLDENTNLT